MSAASDITAKPIVVKVGGGALKGGALEDLPEILESGTRVVIMHGGGPSLTRMLDALEIPTKFHQGLRVTDERTLEVAEMVFAGSVNKALVRDLRSLGVPAAGISGTDGPTLLVEPIPGLGRVGSVERVDLQLIRAMWDGGFVPAVAPLGIGPEGAYNVNADMAAGAIATQLGAGHLFLLTDVDGLLDGGETVTALAPGESEGYVESGLAAGGMIPKLRAASQAARAGVEARIVNGNREGTLREALAGENIGTLISEGAVA
ncbi:MAG: acetylglutamate kinase [Rubrobacter sp.]|nr:acetylglutamate kinase [Rubrobacter sp.]